MTTYFKVGENNGTITAVKLKTYYETRAFGLRSCLLENTRIPNIEPKHFRPGQQSPTIALRCEQLPRAFIMGHLFNPWLQS
jgi:hypothetical protein